MNRVCYLQVAQWNAALLYQHKSRWSFNDAERLIDNSVRLSSWSAAQGNGESLRLTGVHLAKQREKPTVVFPILMLAFIWGDVKLVHVHVQNALLMYLRR